MRHTALASAVLIVAAALPAQLRITEVLVDPLGPDAGFQVVELENVHHLPVDVAGWHVAAANAVVALPALVIPAGRILRVHVGRLGQSTPADLFLPSLPPLARDDTFAVLRGNDPNDPALVVDFVAWGAGRNGSFAAVGAGQWPSTLVSVPLPVGEGVSIAHYGDAAFGGPDEPDAWYADRTPTLGLPNDPGSIFNLGMGCPGAGQAPWVGLARPESRPWLGETFELDVFNVPPAVRSAGLVIGFRRTPPVPLDPLGLTGCAALVSLDFAAGVPLLAGQGVFAVRIPTDPGLTGAAFYPQALVSWPGAPNPAQALVSNAVVCRIGSR